MAETEKSALSRRAKYTTYAASFFSVAILPMANLVVPLWALAIGASPFEIGLIMGARSLLPLFLSIHAGALIDRLGTRRVMVFSAVFSAAFSMLYPVLPFVWGLISLQVVLGLITTMGWIGAQTHIGLLTRGDPVQMGRFTSISIFANFVGPLIAGIGWDRLGPWGAFGLMVLWAVAMGYFSSLLPARAKHSDRDREAAPGLMPNMRDYADALRLSLVPAVGFVIACSLLMNASLSIRFGFYAVYLESLDMTGTVIGFLVGVSSLIGSFAALTTGPLTRIMSQHWLLVITVMLSIAAIAVTPLATEFLPLFLLACLFGFGNGLSFTQLISILSRVVPAHQLGMSVGVRTTVNRLSSLTVPVLMGAIVEISDIATSFYAVGALLACGALAAAFVLARYPAASRPPVGGMG